MVWVGWLLLVIVAGNWLVIVDCWWVCCGLGCVGGCLLVAYCGLLCCFSGLVHLVLSEFVVGLPLLICGC